MNKATTHRYTLAAIALLAIIVGIVYYYFLRHSRSTPRPSISTLTTTTPSIPSTISCSRLPVNIRCRVSTRSYVTVHTPTISAQDAMP